MPKLISGPLQERHTERDASPEALAWVAAALETAAAGQAKQAGNDTR